MSTKPFYLSIFSILILGLFVGLQGAKVVHAQSAAPASSCLTCHEDQYYLHDSGKWYCITEAHERCVNCHAGVINTLDKVNAHNGLIANPLSDGGQRCHTCHVQDAEKLIEKVVGLTGYHAQTKTEAYIPRAPVTAGLPTSLPDSSEAQAPIWFGPFAVIVFTLWVRLVTRTSRA